jgi:ankyrin repeat protein
MAVMKGNEKITKYLVEQGHANVNLQSAVDGSTALHIAIRQRHEDIAQFLIEVGKADVLAEDKVKDFFVSRMEYFG